MPCGLLPLGQTLPQLVLLFLGVWRSLEYQFNANLFPNWTGKCTICRVPKSLIFKVLTRFPALHLAANYFSARSQVNEDSTKTSSIKKLDAHHSLAALWEFVSFYFSVGTALAYWELLANVMDLPVFHLLRCSEKWRPQRRNSLIRPMVQTLTCLQSSWARLFKREELQAIRCQHPSFTRKPVFCGTLLKWRWRMWSPV